MIFDTKAKTNQAKYKEINKNNYYFSLQKRKRLHSAKRVEETRRNDFAFYKKYKNAKKLLKNLDKLDFVWYDCSYESLSFKKSKTRGKTK